MKNVIKSLAALVLAAAVLIILARVSIWLSLAFSLTFAPDLATMVVADVRRLQRQRSLFRGGALNPRDAATI